jgi:hypothetical protein
VKNASTWIATAYGGAAVPPIKFNAAKWGETCCAVEVLKTDMSFKIVTFQF